MNKLFAGACLFLFSVSSAWAGPSVLIVDIQRILNDSHEAQAQINAFDLKADKEKKEFAKQIKELEVAKKDLEEGQDLDHRDAKWYAKYLDAVTKEAKLRARYAHYQLLAADERVRKIASLMRGARMAARPIMKARGASIVIISKMGKFEFNNEKQYQEELLFRRVLVADEKAADITAEVLKSMNEWWKQNKPAPKKEGSSSRPR